jgi:alkylation response protein AidB-like acyl-CoA dehydrogenase
VAARSHTAAGPSGISLLLVDRGTPGFEVGPRLEKIGQRAQDTAELWFDNVRVPSANILGGLGDGLGYLMANLVQERLSIAVNAIASAEAVLEATAEHCVQRTAFEQPIGTFQHIRFTLADLVTAVHVQRVFVDRCLQDHLSGILSPATAAMAKLSATETQKHVVDRCLQLHGGYGYNREYLVGRAFMDTRVQTIYGGTSEIMKEIIGRALGFGEKRSAAR